MGPANANLLASEEDARNGALLEGNVNLTMIVFSR